MGRESILKETILNWEWKNKHQRKEAGKTAAKWARARVGVRAQQCIPTGSLIAGLAVKPTGSLRTGPLVFIHTKSSDTGRYPRRFLWGSVSSKLMAH